MAITPEEALKFVEDNLNGKDEETADLIEEFIDEELSELYEGGKYIFVWDGLFNPTIWADVVDRYAHAGWYVDCCHSENSDGSKYVRFTLTPQDPNQRG